MSYQWRTGANAHIWAIMLFTHEIIRIRDNKFNHKSVTISSNVICLKISRFSTNYPPNFLSDSLLSDSLLSDSLLLDSLLSDNSMNQSQLKLWFK